MAELLVEFYSEEIPARMQKQAAIDLKNMALKEFQEANVPYNNIVTHVAPRRLMLFVDGLPQNLPDSVVAKKGPKVGINEAAIAGFLASVNKKISELEIREVGKDQVYFAITEQKGVNLDELLPKFISKILHNFPWPKSMRWGSHKCKWVRPLRNILAIFDGKVLDVQFEHLKANNLTFGHRFMANKQLEISSYKDYLEQLEKNYIVLDAESRKEQIRKALDQAAKEKNCSLVADEGLLEEVTGLVEWSNVIAGDIQLQFMSLPKEVLITSMRVHQKYFALEKSDKTLAPHFLLVANIKSNDNCKQIIKGNERVLSARLADAQFFIEQDRKRPLKSYNEDLKKVIFHAKLGSVYDKVQRIRQIAANFPADKALIDEAANLAKADLVTNIVGEFPELQGFMGGYYIQLDGSSQIVADAIMNHYSPLGPNDKCPDSEVGAAVAIADKIDSITGLYLAGEKPTGSKDPFALRRSALGVIRIILENNIKIDLKKLFEQAIDSYSKIFAIGNKQEILSELLDFIAKRLEQTVKGQFGANIIAAVFNHRQNYDLNSIIRKAEALESFTTLEHGKELLTAYSRACRIVDIEQVKDNKQYNGEIDQAILETVEEKQLVKALQDIRIEIETSIKQENYIQALKLLNHLRDPINQFFDNVMVNVSDQKIRTNRLLILSKIKELLESIADFSLLKS